MRSINHNTIENILDGMVEGVITINAKGIVQTFNKSAVEIFGYQAEEIIGSNINRLMPKSHRDMHDNYMQTFAETGEANIIGIGRNLIGMRKNGESVPIRLSIREYPDTVNGEKWYIGSCTDITLQQKQEEQLQNSNKMEAIGNLTIGIAHDYNNMLNVILGFSELLQEKLNDSPALLDYINQIIHAANRGSELSKKLLSISKQKTGKETRVNISDVLQNDYNILQKSVTAHIKIKLSMAKDLWSVFCDPGGLEDAILNMTINAKHAMPEGGSINIATENTRIGSVESQVLQVISGDYIKVTISDSGVGMSKEVASHIFEPFFSTKNELGTGLGLSQVYGFIKQSKGAIKVYSEIGYGTCFSIYLPRYTGTTNEDGEINIAEIKPRTGAGNILVVDDEPAIRSLVDAILSSAGYNVLQAHNGTQALDMLAANKVDVVISDVIMPEMDGYELAHIIHHTYPNIKVQLTSGFSENRGKTVCNEQLYKKLLHKPYTSEELLNRVLDMTS